MVPSLSRWHRQKVIGMFVEISDNTDGLINEKFAFRIAGNYFLFGKSSSKKFTRIYAPDRYRNIIHH